MGAAGGRVSSGVARAPLILLRSRQCMKLVALLCSEKITKLMLADFKKNVVQMKNLVVLVMLQEGQHPLTGQHAANFRLLAN